MKRITVYECEICGRRFSSGAECEAHEIAHYGLSAESYAEWKALTKKAADAGHRVGLSKNPETDAVFDAAITRLVDFEKEHGLTNKQKLFNVY